MDNILQRDILLYIAQTVGAVGVSIIVATGQNPDIAKIGIGVLLCLMSAGMLWFRKEMKLEDYRSKTLDKIN